MYLIGPGGMRSLMSSSHQQSDPFSRNRAGEHDRESDGERDGKRDGMVMEKKIALERSELEKG